MRLKKIDPISCGTVFGLIYAAMGLIFGGLFSLFALLGFALGGNDGMIGLLMGVGGFIFAPLFYGAFGFIFGALSAWLYNLIARRTGGIEMEFDNM